MEGATEVIHESEGEGASSAALLQFQFVIKANNGIFQ